MTDLTPAEASCSVSDHAHLSDHEVNMLATYNAEVSRGLLHTPEWAAEMAALQQRFDAHGYVSAERDRLLDRFLGGGKTVR